LSLSTPPSLAGPKLLQPSRADGQTLVRAGIVQQQRARNTLRLQSNRASPRNIKMLNAGSRGGANPSHNHPLKLREPSLPAPVRSSQARPPRSLFPISTTEAGAKKAAYACGDHRKGRGFLNQNLAAARSSKAAVSKIEPTIQAQGATAEMHR